MGVGKRWTHKLTKKDETTPGPGMYTNVAPDSIEINSIREMKKSASSKHAFGVTKDQNAKLQYHGQERDFLGRYGADVGLYEMPSGLKMLSTRSKLENSKLTIP